LGLAAGAIYLGLLDHCLIVSSGVSLDSPATTVLAIQAGFLIVVAMMVNGALPAFTGLLEDLSGRNKLFLVGIPLVFFLASPHLLSQSLYGARFGPLDARNHPFIWRDLSICCVNPFQQVSDGKGAVVR
jgi:hypothetical protein